MMIYHAEVCCIVYTSACFGVGFDVACNIEINGKWLKLCLSYILTFMNGVRCRDRRCAVNKIYFEKKTPKMYLWPKDFLFQRQEFQMILLTICYFSATNGSGKCSNFEHNIWLNITFNFLFETKMNSIKSCKILGKFKLGESTGKNCM